MKILSSPRRRETIMLTAIVAGVISAFTASAQPGPPTSSQVQQALPQPSAEMLRAWEQEMSRKPMPKKGCFKSAYPSKEWQEVPCAAAPPQPYGPARGLRTELVGNGTDYVAISATGSISQAIGSFDSVTGVINETGTTYSSNCTNPVSNVPDTFTLQLNTNTFTTATCSGATCKGWQQFVFSNTYRVAFMQYWMLQ